MKTGTNELSRTLFAWYSNESVVISLEAMQKMIALYHKRDVHMLKLVCTLPNLASICLHKATDAKFYPFTEGDEELLGKFQEGVVAGQSIVCKRKAVLVETFIRISNYLCKSVVEIDDSRIYLNSMCQPVPNGLNAHWDFDSETSRFTL